MNTRINSVIVKALLTRGSLRGFSGMTSWPIRRDLCSSSPGLLYPGIIREARFTSLPARMSWRSWGDTSSTRGRSSAATAPGRLASWGCLTAGLAGGGTGATELAGGSFVLHHSCELGAWGPTWGTPGGASNPLLNPWVRPADWAVGRGFRSTSLGPAAGSRVTSFDVARESWPSAVARGAVTMGAAGVSRVTSRGWAAGACCWRMVVAS